MNITPATRVTVARDVYAREFDGDLVIVDLKGGDYFGLDVVGARVWASLVGGASVEEVVKHIAATHDAPRDRVLADVIAVTEQLVRRGLLVPESET
jgi:hypothetical protein